jgi:cation:H+ antiporter
MTLLTLFLFLAGIALLVFGAEFLVRGASALALRLGISPLVVGLTVVAYGTSSPELAVSVSSAWQGRPDLAVGNVIGSNIANILLILGLSAAITPLVVAQKLVRIDVPIMIGVSLLFAWFARDGSLARWEGVALFAGAVAYTVFAVRSSRLETPAVQAEYDEELTESSAGAKRPFWRLVALIAGGLALLTLGSHWLVEGATAFARFLGVSELVIGLTIVAIGTSLPEVATSVVAAVRGERDIAVGNVVGSNIFNLLLVLGASALVAPGGVAVSEQARGLDSLVMIAVAFLCLPIFLNGFNLRRWEGLLFLFYYAAYLTLLVLKGGQSPSFVLYAQTMGFFVIPLTILTILGGLIVYWRGNARQ